MVVLIVILALFAGLILYLLFMPLELLADSAERLLSLRIGGLAKASVEEDPAEGIRLHLKALFMNFYWRPSDFRKRRASQKTKEKKRKSAKRNFKPNWGKLLRSFRIKAFRLDMDTGDVLLNAKLFPLFALLDHRMGGFGINFQDYNRLYLRMENRPIRLLTAIINP